MRRFFIFPLLFLFSAVCAQTKQWAWMAGESTIPAFGIYGTKGVASAQNQPGARQGGVSWTDAAGNFWVFGGNGLSSTGQGNLNDLWKYDQASNQWTWMSGDNGINATGIYGTRGVAAAGNKPGARQFAASWQDAAGNFYLFGGYGYHSTSMNYLNDLWKYDPTTNAWTWLHGDNAGGGAVYGTKGTAADANKPGGRYYATISVDASGTAWLFGGNGINSSNYPGYLNDLWKYNPATNRWTWVSGDNVATVSAVYGTKGVSSASNKPGGRIFAGSWCDASGNLWVFGGSGFVGGNSDMQNDLWRFTPSNNQWTWMSGDNTLNPGAVYGTKGLAGANNRPGARQTSMCWTEGGKAYVFGGRGRDASSVFGMLNDLWRYDPANGQWTWLQGEKEASARGNYVSKGVPSAEGYPSGRWVGHLNRTSSGCVYLMGGSNGSSLNDLWQFELSTGLWTWVQGPASGFSAPVYGEKGVEAAGNTPGARVNATSWSDPAGNIWVFGGTVTALGAHGNDLWNYNPTGNQWTWVSGDKIPAPAVYGTKGVADAANKPGGRQYAAGWTDALGRLYLFGGTGYTTTPGSTGLLNDLWRFDPATNRWTWIGGDNTHNIASVYGTKGTAAAGNKPGGRNGAIAWTDLSGNGWLFGGSGYASAGTGLLNDLWHFNPGTSQWTWVSGDNVVNSTGVYGTKGTAATGNKPGGRQNPAVWRDGTGQLYLFGGWGYATTGNGLLNDLWRFNPGTSQWTWVSGDNVVNSTGVYGTKGTAATGNKPGGRQLANAWPDAAGNGWLFGGNGYASAGSGSLNDLWMFDSNTDQWSWQEGSDQPNVGGVYDKKGSSPLNSPGARYSVAGKDLAGNFYVFSGSGFASAGGAGALGDLWRYGAPVTISLPVTLVQFTAERVKEGVLLRWETSLEENSSYFAIERAGADGRFLPLGRVSARGESQVLRRYQFTDVQPGQLNLYRLYQVDKDGKGRYSKVVRVSMEENELDFSVLQNPVTDRMTLGFQLARPEKLLVTVTGSNGQVVLRQAVSVAAGASQQRIAVDALPAGLYTVSVSGPTTRSKLFVKQ